MPIPPEKTTNELAAETIKGLDAVAPVLKEIYSDGIPERIRTALFNARISAVVAQRSEYLDDDGVLSRLAGALETVKSETGRDVLDVFLQAQNIDFIPMLGHATPYAATVEDKKDESDDDQPDTPDAESKKPKQ